MFLQYLPVCKLMCFLWGPIFAAPPLALNHIHEAQYSSIKNLRSKCISSTKAKSNSLLTLCRKIQSCTTRGLNHTRE
ncbi:unnamed protein product [Hermetia illucens]|uniref:Secreted protein n=1 Tax=Hermetia illucens TaxID=343691 RepID=A0A7R8YMK8_HERIL|nr:unnamed protein product [Hermetia illucens]